MTKEYCPLLVVAALLRNDAREILVQQRPVGTSMAGLWEFPGGKIEPGETPEVALARELREELGIDVDMADLDPLDFATASLDDGRALILLLFRCARWRDEPRPLHADALRWIHARDLRDLPMPPADRPLVEALIRADDQG